MNKIMCIFIFLLPPLSLSYVPAKSLLALQP
nr:MAG TPA: hypothetical protein [Caudoviricetes sp.]